MDYIGEAALRAGTARRRSPCAAGRYRCCERVRLACNNEAPLQETPWHEPIGLSRAFSTEIGRLCGARAPSRMSPIKVQKKSQGFSVARTSADTRITLPVLTSI